MKNEEDTTSLRNLSYKSKILIVYHMTHKFDRFLHVRLHKIVIKVLYCNFHSSTDDTSHLLMVYGVYMSADKERQSYGS